jgi:malate dehydrogenase (oxaloacetate-decarboxylating)
MFLAAARTLSDGVRPPTGPAAPLLPPLEEIRAVSRRIALAVGVEAQRQGLARRSPHQEWEQMLDASRWEPRYRPMRYHR